MIRVLYFNGPRIEVECGQSRYMVHNPWLDEFFPPANIYFALWQVTICEIARLEAINNKK